MSVAILISGRGSNMRALVEAGLPIAAVISNDGSAAGLAYARALGLPTAVVAHAAFPSREAFDDALAGEVDRFRPRLVALAGFMRILTPAFVGGTTGGCSTSIPPCCRLSRGCTPMRARSPRG